MYIVSSPIKICRTNTPVSNPSFDMTFWGFFHFDCVIVYLTCFVGFLFFLFLGGIFFFFCFFCSCWFLLMLLLCFVFCKVHCFFNYSAMFKHRIIVHFKELVNNIIIDAKVYCKSNFISWRKRWVLFIHYTISLVQITELIGSR